MVKIDNEEKEEKLQNYGKTEKGKKRYKKRGWWRSEGMELFYNREKTMPNDVVSFSEEFELSEAVGGVKLSAVGINVPKKKLFANVIKLHNKQSYDDIDFYKEMQQTLKELEKGLPPPIPLPIQIYRFIQSIIAKIVWFCRVVYLITRLLLYRVYRRLLPILKTGLQKFYVLWKIVRPAVFIAVFFPGWAIQKFVPMAEKVKVHLVGIGAILNFSLWMIIVAIFGVLDGPNAGCPEVDVVQDANGTTIDLTPSRTVLQSAFLMTIPEERIDL